MAGKIAKQALEDTTAARALLDHIDAQDNEIAQYIGKEREFTITDDQVNAVYEVLINKSWRNGDEHEAYQDAWRVVSALLGIDIPWDDARGCLPPKSKAPAVICPDCEGALSRCKRCAARGWVENAADQKHAL